jgi:cobalt-zinc-cadmium resistance protein CzcA
VLGTVFMLIGANSREVAQAAAAKLEEPTRSLPAGVSPSRSTTAPRWSTAPSHRREEPARRRAAGDRGAVPAAGQFRAALITAAVIPLAMLFTITGMVRWACRAT